MPAPRPHGPVWEAVAQTEGDPGPARPGPAAAGAEASEAINRRGGGWGHYLRPPLGAEASRQGPAPIQARRSESGQARRHEVLKNEGAGEVSQRPRAPRPSRHLASPNTGGELSLGFKTTNAPLPARGGRAENQLKLGVKRRAVRPRGRRGWRGPERAGEGQRRGCSQLATPALRMAGGGHGPDPEVPRRPWGGPWDRGPRAKAGSHARREARGLGTVQHLVGPSPRQPQVCERQGPLRRGACPPGPSSPGATAELGAQARGRQTPLIA